MPISPDPRLVELFASLAAPGREAAIPMAALKVQVAAAFAKAKRQETTLRGTDLGLQRLEKVNRRIMALAAELDRMGSDELVALASEGGARREMLFQLQEWNETVVAAHRRLNNGSTVPQWVGGDRKPVARRVALACAEAFAALTGDDPTVAVDWKTSKAGGRFLELVAGVFSILEINGSPENFAREARKDRRRGK